eukprot:13882759-Alexandrium_andersonii.AAC.1
MGRARVCALELRWARSDCAPWLHCSWLVWRSALLSCLRVGSAEGPQPTFPLTSRRTPPLLAHPSAGSTPRA